MNRCGYVPAIGLFWLIWIGTTLNRPAQSAEAQPPQNVPPYIVSGTVRNSVTHAPISQATVGIYSRDPVEFEKWTLTDREGRFRLGEVPAGQSYILRTSKPGLFDKYDLESDEEHGALDVVVGPNTKPFALSLTPGGRIKGEVVDETGRPVEGLSLQVLREQEIDGKREFSLWRAGYTTVKTGEFEVGYLEPGTYVIRTEEREVYYPTWIPDSVRPQKYLSASSKPLTLSAGQLAHSSIRVIAGSGSERSICQCPNEISQPRVGVPSSGDKYTFAGTVLLSDSDRPLSGVLVSLSSMPGYSNMATQVTKADGKFVFRNLVPGVYRLEGQRRDILSQAYNEREGRLKDVVVGPSSNTEHIIFRLHPRGGLSGTVLNENGDPIEYARVALFRRMEDGKIQLCTQPPTPFATTDAVGHFYFGYLESGTYLVAVKSARPWYANACSAQLADAGPCRRSGPADVVYPVTYSGSSVNEATASPITVPEGGLASTRVVLRAVAALHPRFTYTPANSQSPPPELELTSAEFGTYTSGGLFYEQPAWVDDHLVVEGLAPGRYIVKLRNQATCPAETSIDIRGDQTFDLNCKASIGRH